MGNAKMNKKLKLILTVFFWIITLVILYNKGFLTTDLNEIDSIIKQDPIEMRLLFVLLSVIRVIAFIPQTVFIIAGSVVFSFYECFLLSVISLVLSQSIMYFIGKKFGTTFLRAKVLEKNKYIISSLKKYKFKILALGIACPILPSDLITIVSATLGMNYKKSMLTIAIAGSPIILLYSLLGTGYNNSVYVKVISIITVAISAYYIFSAWHKYLRKNKRLIKKK
jgi:uncharacterized membrane protein YdjX (TVP38/TMEM64 family)